MVMSKIGVTYDFESSLKQGFMWWSEDAPTSLGGNVEFSSAEGVCDISLAGNPVRYLV